MCTCIIKVLSVRYLETFNFLTVPFYTPEKPKQAVSSYVCM